MIIYTKVILLKGYCYWIWTRRDFHYYDQEFNTGCVKTQRIKKGYFKMLKDIQERYKGNKYIYIMLYNKFIYHLCRKMECDMTFYFVSKKHTMSGYEKETLTFLNNTLLNTLNK